MCYQLNSQHQKMCKNSYVNNINRMLMRVKNLTQSENV